MKALAASFVLFGVLSCGRTGLRVDVRDGASHADGGCELVTEPEPSERVEADFIVPQPPVDLVLLLDTSSSMVNFDQQARRLGAVIVPELLFRLPQPRVAITTFADFPSRHPPRAIPPSTPFRLRRASVCRPIRTEFSIFRA